MVAPAADVDRFIARPDPPIVLVFDPVRERPKRSSIGR